MAFIWMATLYSLITTFTVLIWDGQLVSLVRDRAIWMKGYFSIVSSDNHNFSIFISTEFSKRLITLVTNPQVVIAVLVKKKNV